MPVCGKYRPGKSIHVYRGENVLALNTLRNHDGILEVVTLPGHESHLQVTTQRQLALLRRITFGQDLAFGHLVARQNGRFQRDRRILVRTTVARQFISRNFRLERAVYSIIYAYPCDQQF